MNLRLAFARFVCQRLDMTLPPAEWSRRDPTGVAWIRRIGAAGVALLLAGGCASLRTTTVPGQDPGPNAAELTVPARVFVQRVNEEERPGPYLDLLPSEETLVLEPGPYRIVAHYRDIYDVERNSDDFKKFQSEPVAVTFTAEPNTRYALVADDPPTTAEEFATDPPVSIRVRRIERMVASIETAAEPAPAATDPSPAAAAASPSPSPSPPRPSPAAGADSSESLLDAWEQASPEEREALLQHLINRP